jgi:hypothetical protein
MKVTQVLFPILVLAAHDLSAAGDSAHAPSIGLLSNAKYKYVNGCGCSFDKPDHVVDEKDQATWEYLFLSPDDEKKGYLFVDGKVVEVARQKSLSVRGNDKKIHAITLYTGGDLKVTIDSIETELVDEVQGVRGTIKVEQAGAAASVEFTGLCGC